MGLAFNIEVVVEFHGFGVEVDIDALEGLLEYVDRDIDAAVVGIDNVFDC